MRKLTLWLLWIFVFSLPWEPFISFEGIGTMSRLTGLLAVGAGMLAIVVERRFRRPGIIVYLALAFTLANLLSLFWSISPTNVPLVFTYVQLLGIVCIVWEFARRAEEQESLMVAYCLGAYVSIADALNSFRAGVSVVDLRYTATNANPNDFGLTLALALPMAWYLFRTRRGIIRFTGAAYLPFAAVAILLTASRGAFLAFVVALSIIPITLSWGSLRSWVMVIGILVVAGGTAAIIVPQYSWDRILTAREEVSAGTAGGRSVIWNAGWRVFQDRPIFGVGAGSFNSAVEPLVGRVASHNVLLAVLVELGITGFFIFAALLGACGWLAYGLPPPTRTAWTVIALTWLVGAMSISWQYSKITWLLFALLAARADAQKESRPRLRSGSSGRPA